MSYFDVIVAYLWDPCIVHCSLVTDQSESLVTGLL